MVPLLARYIRSPYVLCRSTDYCCRMRDMLEVRLIDLCPRRTFVLPSLPDVGVLWSLATPSLSRRPPPMTPTPPSIRRLALTTLPRLSRLQMLQVIFDWNQSGNIARTACESWTLRKKEKNTSWRLWDERTEKDSAGFMDSKENKRVGSQQRWSKERTVIIIIIIMQFLTRHVSVG